MSLVLQKSKQAKTRVDFNGKRVGSKSGIVSLCGIRTLNAWVAAECCKNGWGRSQTSGKFPSAWNVTSSPRNPDREVDQFMPVFNYHMTLLVCRQRTKITRKNRSEPSYVFIFFDNFFKVSLVSTCLLLWNTNGISRISFKNSFVYPKHSQIHFLTDTLVLVLVRNLVPVFPDTATANNTKHDRKLAAF